MPLGGNACNMARTTESLPGSHPAEMTDTAFPAFALLSSERRREVIWGVDVETVHCIDAECKNFFGVLLHAAGSGVSQNGYVYVLQFADILDYVITCQFFGLVFSSVPAYDACHFEVGCGFESL